MINTRRDFPIFKNNPDLMYLDNAATSQKPQQVIDAMLAYYQEYTANVHRSPHRLAERATNEYEKAREKVAGLINAKQSEIIFTKNATESLNLIAYSLHKICKSVTTTIMEHHSNFVPWQQLYKKFSVLDIDKQGHLQFKTNGADVYAITHASNVLGTINDIKAITEQVHDNKAIMVVDASQSAPHLPIDVKKLDVDFMAFTGHKMLGPAGIGVLYTKEGLEAKMHQFLYGGEMIYSVTKDKTIFKAMPYRYEAGTPPIAEAIGLGAAVDYLNNIGIDNVRTHELDILKYALKRFSEEKIIYIGPSKAEQRTGLISFYLDGVHPHDIAMMLDKRNIAIRGGHHCAQPLHDSLGIAASARASFYIYNNKYEVDELINGINHVRKKFYG